MVFIGSDEKSYSFLLKGGEDLRLDSGVQQILKVVGSLVDTSVRTYQVVTLTARVGLLEWVNHTTTLKTLINHQSTLRHGVSLL